MRGEQGESAKSHGYAIGNVITIVARGMVRFDLLGCRGRAGPLGPPVVLGAPGGRALPKPYHHRCQARIDNRAALKHFILPPAGSILRVGRLPLSFSSLVQMNKSFGWSITLSVLMILAGLLAIVIPPLAGVAATLLVGWLLVFCGGAHLLFSWHRRGLGAVAWEILIGILYIAVGVYILAHPVAGLASLTLGLAIYLFAEAVLEFALGVQMRGTKGSGWLWLDGIVNLLLAVMIWKTWPVSSVWLLGTLVGFGILFTAFARLMLSLEARRAAGQTAAPASPTA
jgi:uncharacterized membrane protein HdeD (DUF308 family)